MPTTIKKRLAALRNNMLKAGIQACVIPQTDPHHSEYIADHWQVRRYLSGFTGSAGTLVVTDSAAYLWADSRYWLQGEQQLRGTDIELVKVGVLDQGEITAWLAANTKPGSTIGIDGMLFSVAETVQMRQALQAQSISLKTDFDPVGCGLWPNRPALPQCEVYVHDVKYAGISADDKIEAVLANARQAGADAVFISALDEIAWTLNIRSNDVAYNPVATAHLFLCSCGKRILFIDERKITPPAAAHLTKHNVKTAPYNSILPFLCSLPTNVKVLLSESQSAGTVADALNSRAITGTSAVAMLKGVKNDVEIAGCKQALHRDGVAMVRSLAEIHRTVDAHQPLTEMGVADILLKHRSKGENWVEESFETIAGFGPHGAIVHYSARPATDATIDHSNLLLIDSGGSYLDGSTDITRTIALGEPTADQKRDFTLVFQGHLALALAVFPEGTKGFQLDVLAKLPMWRDGKRYYHGTGHGVGHCLNVHEGPQSIRDNNVNTPLLPGMNITDEPGLYLADRYGIRCENMLLVVPAFESEYGRFLRFETITICPYDRKLFDLSIMTPAEIDWVNQYHARCWEQLSPDLDGADLEWLRQATLPL